MMDLVNGFPPWGGVGGPSPFPYPGQRRILTQPLGGHTFLLIICLLMLYLSCNSSVTCSSLISDIGSGVQNFALQIFLKSILKFEYMIDK